MARVDLDKLRDSGDTIELDDDRLLRLRVEPDDDFDGQWSEYLYGKYGFDGPANDYATRTRPDGFDGNSERLYYGNEGPWWWQPPADGPKRGTPEFAALRNQVRELLAFGFVGLVLELCEGKDAYGQPIVRDAASLWGIESTMDDAYRVTVLEELVTELGIEQDKE